MWNKYKNKVAKEERSVSLIVSWLFAKEFHASKLFFFSRPEKSDTELNTQSFMTTLITLTATIATLGLLILFPANLYTYCTVC